MLAFDERMLRKAFPGVSTILLAAPELDYLGLVRGTKWCAQAAARLYAAGDVEMADLEYEARELMVYYGPMCDPEFARFEDGPAVNMDYTVLYKFMDDQRACRGVRSASDADVVVVDDAGVDVASSMGVVDGVDGDHHSDGSVDDDGVAHRSVVVADQASVVADRAIVDDVYSSTVAGDDGIGCFEDQSLNCDDDDDLFGRCHDPFSSDCPTFDWFDDVDTRHRFDTRYEHGVIECVVTDVEDADAAVGGDERVPLDVSSFEDGLVDSEVCGSGCDDTLDVRSTVGDEWIAYDVDDPGLKCRRSCVDDTLSDALRATVVDGITSVAKSAVCRLARAWMFGAAVTVVGGIAVVALPVVGAVVAHAVVKAVASTAVGERTRPPDDVTGVALVNRAMDCRLTRIKYKSWVQRVSHTVLSMILSDEYFERARRVVGVGLFTSPFVDGHTKALALGIPWETLGPVLLRHYYGDGPNDPDCHFLNGYCWLRAVPPRLWMEYMRWQPPVVSVGFVRLLSKHYQCHCSVVPRRILHILPERGPHSSLEYYADYETARAHAVNRLRGLFHGRFSSEFDSCRDVWLTLCVLFKPYPNTIITRDDDHWFGYDDGRDVVARLFPLYTALDLVGGVLRGVDLIDFTKL